MDREQRMRARRLGADPEDVTGSRQAIAAKRRLSSEDPLIMRFVRLLHTSRILLSKSLPTHKPTAQEVVDSSNRLMYGSYKWISVCTIEIRQDSIVEEPVGFVIHFFHSKGGEVLGDILFFDNESMTKALKFKNVRTIQRSFKGQDSLSGAVKKVYMTNVEVTPDPFLDFRDWRRELYASQFPKRNIDRLMIEVKVDQSKYPDAQLRTFKARKILLEEFEKVAPESERKIVEASMRDLERQIEITLGKTKNQEEQEEELRIEQERHEGEELDSEDFEQLDSEGNLDSELQEDAIEQAEHLEERRFCNHGDEKIGPDCFGGSDFE